MEYIILGAVLLLVVLSAASIYLLMQKKEEKINLAPVVEEVRNEFSRNRRESSESAKETREELGNVINSLNSAQREKFNDFAARQDKLKEDTTSKLEKIRETVETRLQSLQQENIKKLDEMRGVVDEKLQSTLEKRFNESFKLISERLELVHKGLGEMQSLASGVGDLKKVLTNVKTRGNLGEYQLAAILEQFLAAEQYIKNASVKPNTLERVEYAIKLPGRTDDAPLLLAIDSKFPVEDYQRLQDAYENADGAIIEVVSKQFESAVKKSAKDISDKYINPPATTDFAIMFVPTEGLYAEILRRTGLFEALRRDYNVVIQGPSNIVAFLNSLQMGFRTIAVEKRSSEVWEVLGAVKNEFGKFGDVLAKTKKKLQEASNTIENAEVRARQIGKQLRKVEELPNAEAESLFEEAEELLEEEVA